jgi:hypothetical protein
MRSSDTLLNAPVVLADAGSISIMEFAFGLIALINPSHSHHAVHNLF